MQVSKPIWKTNYLQRSNSDSEADISSISNESKPTTSYLQSDSENITINQDVYKGNKGERVITSSLSLEEILKNRIQAERKDPSWNV